MQTTFDVQRQIGRTMMVSAGYVHTNGRNLPIVRNFALAFDRETGARPNPISVASTRTGQVGVRLTF